MTITEICLIIISLCLLLITVFGVTVLFTLYKLSVKTTHAVDGVTQKTTELLDESKNVVKKADGLINKVDSIADNAKYGKMVFDILKIFKRK